MKNLFYFIILSSLTLKSQSDLPPKIYEYVSDIQTELIESNCECMNSKVDYEDLRKVLDFCWEDNLEKMENQFTYVKESKEVQGVVKDSTLSMKLNNLFQSQMAAVVDSLAKNCSSFREIAINDETDLIQNICVERFNEIYKRTLNSDNLCICMKNDLKNVMVNDLDYWENKDNWNKEGTEILIEKSLSQILINGTDLCLDFKKDLWTEDFIWIDSLFIKELQLNKELEMKQEGLNDIYDVEKFCDCLYERINRRILSLEWIKYLNYQDSVVDKIEKKCLKKTKIKGR